MHKHVHFLYIIIIVFISIFSHSCVSKKNLSTNNTSTILSNDKDAELSGLFIQACSEKLFGKLNEAEFHFKMCESILPSSAAVQYELSNLYRLNNKNKESVEYAEKAVKNNPNNIWYQQNLIKSYHTIGKYNQAIAVLKKLIEKNPRNEDLYRQLILEHELNNQPYKALEVLNTMEKKFGYSFDIMYDKVTLLYFMNKPVEVEKELKKYLNIFPNDYKAKEVLAGMFYKNKEINKAIDLSKELLAQDSLNSTAHLILYDYYIFENNEEKAYYHLNELFKNPDYDIKDKLGILIKLYNSSRNEKGVDIDIYRLCQTFLSTHPMAPEAHSIYADFLLRDSKKQEAATEYYKAAIFSKNKYAIWEQLLSVEYELNLYDSMIKHSNLAIESFPNQPALYFYQGIGYRNLKQYDKAITAYNTAIDYALDNNLLLENIYIEMGELYNEIKKYPESDKYFDNALKINPENANTLNNYSYYLSLRKEKLDKAEQMSKKSLDIASDNANYLDTYAWILYQEKKYAEAEKWMKMALDKKHSFIMLEHYGDILYHLNKKDKAMEYWIKSKEAGNTSEILLKKIQTNKIDE